MVSRTLSEAQEERWDLSLDAAAEGPHLELRDIQSSGFSRVVAANLGFLFEAMTGTSGTPFVWP